MAVSHSHELPHSHTASLLGATGWLTGLPAPPWVSPDPACSSAEDGLTGVLVSLRISTYPWALCADTTDPPLWIPASAGYVEAQWSIHQLCHKILTILSPCEALTGAIMLSIICAELFKWLLACYKTLPTRTASSSGSSSLPSPLCYFIP